MTLQFSKYQGTGNDFIIIDNRQLLFPKNDTTLIANLCHRKLGIGADGLILLENHPQEHFTMVYYNADGNQSSMCGNGGRCIVHFAHSLGLIEEKAVFEAIDGMHHATIKGNNVSLQMSDVAEIFNSDNFCFLNTGSPHHIELVSDLDTFPVVETGRSIRNERYGLEGSNINFVEKISEETFKVRTYERGVEDETLSCGTGVTAVALAMYARGETAHKSIRLQTPGGELTVDFKSIEDGFESIFLKGPATFVFKGTYIWEK